MTERVWALAGPRQLNADGLRLVGATTLALLEGGARLAVGCCTGADAAAVHAAVQVGYAQRLTIWCAFGECRRDAPARTPGTCRWSAPAMVACAAAAGAQVRAWAGGGAEVPLAARLARRTRAVAGAATAGALVWLPRQSHGTLLLARCALRGVAGARAGVAAGLPRRAVAAA